MFLMLNLIAAAVVAGAWSIAVWAFYKGLAEPSPQRRSAIPADDRAPELALSGRRAA